MNLSFTPRSVVAVAATGTVHQDLRMKCTSLFVLAPLLYWSGNNHAVEAAGRFARQGLVLTVTLPSSGSTVNDSDGNDDSNNNNNNNDNQRHPNMLAELQPLLTYSIASQKSPLPYWLPALKSIVAGIGYQYSSLVLPVWPSWLEGTAKFGFRAMPNVMWQLQPRLSSSSSSLVVQASRGDQTITAKFATRQQQPQQKRERSRLKKAMAKNKYSNENDDNDSFTPFWNGGGLEAVRASFLWSTVPLAALASLRVSPHVDVPNRAVSCQIEAVTGGAGRTVATLNLHPPSFSSSLRNKNNNKKSSTTTTTLAIQYQPDAHNWIKPVLDLCTGHMQYQWIVALPHHRGSVHTLVDPADAIAVTWTDTSTNSNNNGGGTWVTDIRIPLHNHRESDVGGDGTRLPRLQSLFAAADVRVRRQFRF